MLFIDFSKAYDRIPRAALMRKLKRMGCGPAMVVAIACMYSGPQMALGAVVITVTVGVGQGSPSSCFLLAFFKNDLIRAFKRRCTADSFLEWLHCLTLIDDTVILATSRERCKEKNDVLLDYCTRACWACCSMRHRQNLCV